MILIEYVKYSRFLFDAESEIFPFVYQYLLGELPDVDLPHGCVAGILCSEVFHFLSPEKVEKVKLKLRRIRSVAIHAI